MFGGGYGVVLRKIEQISKVNMTAKELENEILKYKSKKVEVELHPVYQPK
jgi:hypothetical protein